MVDVSKLLVYNMAAVSKLLVYNMVAVSKFLVCNMVAVSKFLVYNMVAVSKFLVYNMVAVSKFLNFCAFVALVIDRYPRFLIKMSESLQFRLFITSTPIFVGWTREFSSEKIFRRKKLFLEHEHNVRDFSEMSSRFAYLGCVV